MNKQLRDQILDCLYEHGQAVTYGALAGVVGGDPSFVMNDLKRNKRNSWVVAEKDNLPSGYAPEFIDERLLTDSSMSNTLNGPKELLDWLEIKGIKI